jgi:outer membrane immunogenic protein
MLFSAAALSVAGVAGAFAADMPVKAPVYAPSHSWTGLYIGANAGYGYGNAPTSVVPNAIESAVTLDPTGFSCPSGNCAPSPTGSRLNGFVGGGQIGYNFQFGNIVAGLETDLSFANLHKSDSAAGPFFIGGIFQTTVETKINWYGTLRTRLGFLPTNNLLVYGTGGLAYGGVKTTVTAFNIAPRNVCSPTGFSFCMTGSTGGTSTGWTIGAGMEYALSPAWTVKAEYLHIDLGNRTLTTTDDPANPGGNLSATTSFKMDTVKLGVNYKLGAL